MAERESKRKAGVSGEITRFCLTIKGIVQGVGFRPYVYNLAVSFGLKGNVRNTGRGVIVDIEGPPAAVELFKSKLKNNPPRLARISNIEEKQLEPTGFKTFDILFSNRDDEVEALVPPDVALCPKCRADVLNSKDRHFAYPFTNCTECGPRFTIVRDLPYDRKSTSMAGFPMCPLCEAEYNDPGNRRFHAQPVACPECGPEIWLADGKGFPVEGHWLKEFKKMIKKGKIFAIKGLGGFHLVCDAVNSRVVQRLRERKGRPAKPFAVMCRDLDTVKKYCFVNSLEAEMLTGPEAPIVVLEKKNNDLPENLAPGLRTLGVMLPYTPLHLLFFDDELEVLVMTSGNFSELPLARDNGEALDQLGGIADFFLFHNREIVNRCDDSLVEVIDGEVHVYRRSRGYVPRGLPVPVESKTPPVLAMGGEMKNTFCLLKGKEAFLSQHIGEMDSIEGENNLLEHLERFSRLIEIKPSVVSYDLHPDYRSSRLGREFPARIHLPVQHHHAHMASCMAENHLKNPVIGAVLDGTGYGTDGSIWGFEILSGDYLSFKRHYHLKYIPLPGGEAAVKNPWMMAVSYLYGYFGEKGFDIAEELFSQKVQEFQICVEVVKKKFNSPLTSSCGRLFDTVSALLNICEHNTYEGQAAIELSELIPREPAPNQVETYNFDLRGEEIDPSEMIKEIALDLKNGVKKEDIAVKFHNTVAAMIGEAVKAVSLETGLKEVVISGGVWQNRYLFLLTRRILESAGFKVFYHRQVPCNDGGISLGQAVIARWRCEKDVSWNTCKSSKN